MAERLLAICERYGGEIFGQVLARIVEVSESKLRARLQELPDGEWGHTSYIDYDGAVYAIRVKMRKQADRLTLDFTESSPQAPAVANCTYSGLLAGVQAAVLAYLCYDIPMCPAGILRPVEIIRKREPSSTPHGPREPPRRPRPAALSPPRRSALAWRKCWMPARPTAHG